jgi:hypothetical protein
MDDAGEHALPKLENWLESDEELEEFTSGYLVEPAAEYDYAIVLTSQYLRVVSVSDEMKFKSSDINHIRWTGLWARLNVSVGPTEKRLVFAISGREWKKKAKSLAKKWSRNAS